MSATILDGKKLAAEWRAKVKKMCDELKKDDIYPTLAVILVGDDPASEVYVRNKQKACEECGIVFALHKLPRDARFGNVASLIKDLNKYPEIHGIILQLPLPKQLKCWEKILQEQISPTKDVDCLHPKNVGHLMQYEWSQWPCTPTGVLELMVQNDIQLKSKHAVIVGRSDIVGKPLVPMLLSEDCTVTICHSKTEDLASHTRMADILISAAGKANLITADMVKPGAAVIDVGINRDANGKLCGDVDFQEVQKVAGWITPVPGGVGPMTVAILMENVVRAAEEVANG